MVTTKAIFFAALSSPSLAQGSHNDHGGNQNQPPSISPIIDAVPLAASAAVNRQMSAVRGTGHQSRTGGEIGDATMGAQARLKFMVSLGSQAVPDYVRQN